MTFFVAGMSYKTAPVEVREQLAVRPQGLKCFGCRLKIGGGLSEVVLLSTCNRVEIYGVANKVNGNIHNLFRYLASRDMDFAPHAYVHEGAEALKHLFSVVSGLDSMVLGETEITGQVKLAYQAAQEGKLTGKVLNRVFQTALQVAKEIRTGTQIGRGAVSVGSVAVELAEKIFDGSLANKTIMILGAGKMGEACIRHLHKRGAKSVMVSNRSPQRAEELAGEFGGRAIRIEDCYTAMAEADIVVSSTGSPNIVLHRRDIEKVMQARRGRPLALIDIAVPRDIDPDCQLLDGVYLYDIDDLEEIMRENLRLREQALAQCHGIIAERSAAVLAKISPDAGRATRVPHFHEHIEHRPGWAFGSAAAVCAG